MLGSTDKMLGNYATRLNGDDTIEHGLWPLGHLMLYINRLGAKIVGNERRKILQVRHMLRRITTHLLRVTVALRLPVSGYPPPAPLC